MKFTKLRITGFKSFVEPSEFLIEPGLTGVVGPNGCGKSNLVESLRWVMGENSYKNMRASGMDDVIFSGSGQRPARNSAEVGLFIDNSDRTAPAAFNDADELQVSRRIEREQGSVYRINGKEARARDVQLLFADASTGARSPAMVGQGRIGELIQAKPQARRQLLEEAAGISGLHSRRHEAELRLKAAETNLERLEDVTAQLTSQIESLKRQARQANRFKQLSASIRAEEAKLLHIRWAEAKTAEAEADSQLNQTTNLVAERAQAQMEAAKTQAIEGLRLPELREAEAQAAAALQRLTIARSQLDEDFRRLDQRRQELERRIAQLSADIAREKQMIAGNSEILTRLDEEEEELRAHAEDAAIRAQELKEQLAEATDNVADAERRMQELTAERAEAAAGRQQTERFLADIAQRRLRLERQVTDARRDLETIEAKLAALPDPDEKREALEAAEIAHEDGEQAALTAEKRLADARLQEGASRRPMEEARSALQMLETEARTIRKMLAAGGESAATPVSELIEADAGWETALGAALGDDLDSPLDAAAAKYWRLNPGAGDPALPSGVEPLSRHVKAPAELARRLAQIGVVSEDDGPRLMTSLAAGQRLVSRSGALWRWDGHVTDAGAPSAAALRLTQKNRLASLENEIEEARFRLEDYETAHEAAREALQTAETRLQQARDMARLLARKLTEAREALVAAEKASADLARLRDLGAEQIAGYETQIDDLAVQEEEARLTLAETPDLSALDLALREQTALVAEHRARLAEARAAHDGEARDNEARARRLTAISSERRLWRDREQSAAAQIETLETREEEARIELEDLLQAPEEFEDRRRALLSELQKAEAARKAAADQLQTQENREREADRAASQALAALAEAREKRGRAEERLLSAREMRIAQELRIRETLNVAPHEVFRLTGLAVDDKLPEIRGIEIEVERLKMERERLGAVNLRAEEEQAELTEKLTNLIRERDDVIDAIRKLRSAIQNLNREGRDRLMVAFDAVNQQFKRLFTHLFNGGEAELQLIESEDPLEAGLEILARPPGKKPQTMTLLSGGEQALTAMALIFAVFLTNPAPICVLDEVDAPLDDHNVERYCNLLDEMTKTTQTRFLVITHNPITMARMNRLYGVTMAEQGVSQLVSVDLQTAERLVDVA
ncbi:chromosome segregation SMC family protein [Rhizobium sp. TRM95796]|uniref:chromosome segregation SMC family protein n=1 Tax=Rhizobium sp. TRM95796 TaxID=2979862 RepID=UPI0021E7722D|nr:chromosome segregation SMC family protein [Rhizobium sp. TRM95796]MCV3766447.1 chromosome segregation protein SMC [Rhizobium sp. TRM95796]